MGQATQLLEYSAGFVDGVAKGYEIAIERVNEMVKTCSECYMKSDKGFFTQTYVTSLNDQRQILKSLERYNPLRDLECRINFTYERKK